MHIENRNAEKNLKEPYAVLHMVESVHEKRKTTKLNNDKRAQISFSNRILFFFIIIFAVKTIWSYKRYVDGESSEFHLCSNDILYMHKAYSTHKAQWQHRNKQQTKQKWNERNENEQKDNNT